MSEALRTFLTLDLAPLLAVTFAAGALGLLGSFLVLERRAMIGDAVAHSVLPGLVIAFLVTGTRAPSAMFLGALGAAAVAGGAIGTIGRFGRLDPTVAIGIVFTTLFALGVLLVATSGARNVDLDLDCVLSGQLELLFWTPPATAAELLQPAVLATLPRETLLLGALFAAVPGLLALVWRPLETAVFDPTYARTRGTAPRLLRAGLFTLQAAAIVASFEALGSILVIALLTCPAAAARLDARTLLGYVTRSCAYGLLAGVAGYLLATRVAPAALGESIDASGTVAVCAGALLAVRAIASRRS